jgi:hypothetical protein
MVVTILSAIAGLGLAAGLTWDLWYGDWWFVGFVLAAMTLSVAYGVIRDRRTEAALDDESPIGVTSTELRGWRFMIVGLCATALVLPALAMYVGLGRWQSVALGAFALAGAISYAVVYRLVKRSSVGGGSR